MEPQKPVQPPTQSFTPQPQPMMESAPISETPVASFSEAIPLSTPNQTTTKKAPVKLLIILAVVIIVVGLGAFLAYTLLAPTTPAVNNTASTSTSTAATQSTASIPNLTSASDALTGSSTSESALTNTDDSSSASDASTSAGSVGGSINENNF